MPRAELRISGENRGALAAIRGTRTDLGRLERTAHQTSRSMSASSAQTTRGLQGVEHQAQRTSGSLSGAFGGLTRIVATGMVAAGGAIGTLATVAGFRFNSIKEQAQIAFSTMLGDGEKARVFLNDLAQFAARTPFEFPDLIRASQRLLAMGIAAKDVMPVMNAVGNSVAAVGGGAEQIDQTTRAIGQVTAKGRLMAEEMMQLNEAGTFSWRALAREIGVSVPKAMDMVTKGQVDASEFQEAFIRNSERNFGGMMERQSRTLAGIWSTFKDTYGQIMGQVLMPFYAEARRQLAGVNRELSDQQTQRTLNRIGQQTARTIIPAFRNLVGWVRRNKTEIVGLGRDGIAALRGVVSALASVRRLTNLVARAVGGWDTAFKLVVTGLIARRIGLIGTSALVASRRIRGVGAAAITAQTMAGAPLGKMTRGVGRVRSSALLATAAFGGWPGAIAAAVLLSMPYLDQLLGKLSEIASSAVDGSGFLGLGPGVPGKAGYETQRGRVYVPGVGWVGAQTGAGRRYLRRHPRARVYPIPTETTSSEEEAKHRRGVLIAQELRRQGASERRIVRELAARGFTDDEIDRIVTETRPGGRYGARRARRQQRQRARGTADTVPADVPTTEPAAARTRGRRRARAAAGPTGGDVAGFVRQVARSPGASARGFHLPGERTPYDCSAFTQAVFRRYGINIGSTTYTQQHAGQPVSRSELEPGDLLFFTYPGERRPGHVGIYVGGGLMVHDHGASRGVEEQGVDWAHFNFARRVMRVGGTTAVGGTGGIGARRPKRKEIPMEQRRAPRAVIAGLRAGFAGLQEMLGDMPRATQRQVAPLMRQIGRMLADNIITNAEAERIKAKLERVRQIVNTAMDKMRDVIAAKRDVLRDAWQTVVDDALEVFDAMTESLVTKARAPFEAETPAERALRELRAGRSATGRANVIAGARDKLALAQRLGDPQMIRDAQAELDDALLDEREAGLESQAEQERKAADEAAEREEKRIRDERRYTRERFQARLAEVIEGLQKEGATAEEAQIAILNVLREFGVDFQNAGELVGTMFAQGFAESINEVIVALGALVDAINQLRAAQGLPPIGWRPQTVSPRQRPIGGPRAGGPAPLQSGGVVMEPILAAIGEGPRPGREAVVPLDDPRSRALIREALGGGGAGIVWTGDVHVHGSAIYEHDLARTIRDQFVTLHRGGLKLPG